MAAVLLYDGPCGLCRAAVRAVLARDPEGRFRFARQDGETGRALLARAGLTAERGRTLVLIDEDGRAFVRSEAVLRVAARLRGPLALLAHAGRLVPRAARDAFYDAVARRRHRLGALPAGGADRCPVAPPALRARFLDDDP